MPLSTLLDWRLHALVLVVSLFSEFVGIRQPQMGHGLATQLMALAVAGSKLWDSLAMPGWLSDSGWPLQPWQSFMAWMPISITSRVIQQRLTRRSTLSAVLKFLRPCRRSLTSTVTSRRAWRRKTSHLCCANAQGPTSGWATAKIALPCTTPTTTLTMPFLRWV